MMARLGLVFYILLLVGLAINQKPIILIINAIVIKAINSNCLLNAIVDNYCTNLTFFINAEIIDFR